MFPLAYQPGEIAFCDFTLLKRVAITLRGEPFPHFCSSTTWLLQAENLLLFGPSGVGQDPPRYCDHDGDGDGDGGAGPGLPLLPRHHAGAASAEAGSQRPTGDRRHLLRAPQRAGDLGAV